MSTEPIHTGKCKNLISSTMMFVWAIVFLTAGGILYIAFRNMSLRMFGWFDVLRLNGMVDGIRTLFHGITPGRFVLYNLPDLLWILSYLLFVNALIPRREVRSYYFWLLLMPVLAIIHEIMQGLGLANGSFDYVDLLCYFIPTAINLIIIIIIENLSKFNFKLNSFQL